MKYRNDLSILGFGCMRFPSDYNECAREVLHAVNCGINYFDTAFVYPGSEDTLGKILSHAGCREQVKIATKLPHYLARSVSDCERYFKTELKRLRTDYIDNYLIHMLPDINVFKQLQKAGILKWLEEKKASGAIGKIGFSYHGNTASFIELIDAYDWDFCQIQYNYLDETSQAGVEGLKYADSKGIPVIIMEPLRGGLLTDKLPAGAKEIFAEAQFRCREASPAEWGLRWLWDQPEVSCVLSGMNSMNMLEENLRIAKEAEAGDLTEENMAVIDEVKKAIRSASRIPCTGCRYCMPCPYGVDIPGVFRCYNSSYIDGYLKGLKTYIMVTSMGDKRANAGLCVRCGRCREHCPQSIDIPNEMKSVRMRLENPAYKISRSVMKFIMTHKKKAR